MNINLKLNEEEVLRFLIDGVNALIEESGRAGEIICVAENKTLTKDTLAKNWELSDNDERSLVLIGIAKKLGLTIDEESYTETNLKGILCRDINGKHFFRTDADDENKMIDYKLLAPDIEIQITDSDVLIKKINKHEGTIDIK